MPNRMGGRHWACAVPVQDLRRGSLVRGAQCVGLMRLFQLPMHDHRPQYVMVVCSANGDAVHTTYVCMPVQCCRTREQTA